MTSPLGHKKEKPYYINIVNRERRERERKRENIKKKYRNLAGLVRGRHIRITILSRKQKNKRWM